MKKYVPHQVEVEAIQISATPCEAEHHVYGMSHFETGLKDVKHIQRADMRYALSKENRAMKQKQRDPQGGSSILGTFFIVQ